MTREEAIELLKEYAPRTKPFYEPYRTEYLAIEALSAEPPTGELISRADAIEAVRKIVPVETEIDSTLLDKAEVIVELSALPSAEAVQGWIPCSERLPKRDELVLVTYKTTDRIHLCKYIDDGSENPWWSYIDDCCAWNNVVLAWMPLPTPYKGGDDE